MDRYKTMGDLQVGEQARIVAVNSDTSMKRRFFDLGLIEGTKIRCLQKSPFGDPVAYLIRNTVIAFRLDDLNKILTTQV